MHHRTLAAALLALAPPTWAQEAPTSDTPVVDAPAAPTPQATGNHIAVVIGISQYGNLPGRVNLPNARSNASELAQSLKDDAHYNHVFLLTDAQATRDAIRGVLQREVGSLAGPDDVLLLYFEGHGVGADFGLPTLLTYDATLENGQEDGLELQSFARDLQAWSHAGTTVIVTDVVHEQQIDGISLFGPSAPHWPRMPTGTMVLSATQPEAAAKEGQFGKTFQRAIAGGADLDYDHVVTLSELYSWVVSQLAPTGQIPVTSGDFSGRSAFAINLDTQPPAPTLPDGVDAPIIDVTAGGVATAPTPIIPLFPDIAVPAVKFVFHDGGSQSVQCKGSELKACDPSCYVRYFRSGLCTVSAVVDGAQLSGQVIVLSKGKYDCRHRGPELVCDGPYL